jgi:hypothetical protein
MAERQRAVRAPRLGRSEHGGSDQKIGCSPPLTNNTVSLPLGQRSTPYQQHPVSVGRNDVRIGELKYERYGPVLPP